MKNEKIVIFGDSYSTFEGHIPEGYASFYPREDNPTVSDVSCTWWKQLASQTASEILLNNSWSGTTICNTGYGGDCSKTTSFICRLGKVIDSGFFEKNAVDRVFVFGGTNDSWTKNEVGNVQFADWSDEDKRRVLPGISFFIHTLLGVMPKEKVHVVINGILREEIIRGMVEICEHYGVGYTRLTDVDILSGHPTYTGMTQIKDQILKNI